MLGRLLFWPLLIIGIFLLIFAWKALLVWGLIITAIVLARRYMRQRQPDKRFVDLRKSQNLSYAQLSRRLTELGCPIAPLGLTRIREHQRRVDVDDLVALALALDVSPATLLFPDDASANGSAPVTEDGGDYPRRQIWHWLIAEAPIDVPTSMRPKPRSHARFTLTAIPDGIGDIVQDILNGLIPAEVQREIARAVAVGYTESQEGDDGDD
jgi:transcriptional regulator with XRE-family HTH domain